MWQEFWRLQGSKLNFSAAYHPQTDGQSEVVNRCVETYLRCFCAHKPYDWAKWLPFWYNTSWHNSTRTTPYQALYGGLPPTIMTYIPKTARLQSVEEGLVSRDVALQLLKDNLVKPRYIMKKFADLHRTEKGVCRGRMSLF